MSIYRLQSKSDFTLKEAFYPPFGLAIGTFDGMHLGHQSIFSILKEELKNAFPDQKKVSMSMMSFYPHPRSVLATTKIDHQNKWLTPLSTKLGIISDLGISNLYLVHFNKNLSQISAADFFEKYILKIKPSMVVVGEDWRFGKDREGNFDLLNKFCEQSGIRAKQVEILSDASSNKVGSSQLRDYLLEGNVEEYRMLTNRCYRIRAKVIKGDQRGVLLGFPTANLNITNQILPKRGVYKTKTIIEGNSYLSVTNIGFKPTFNNKEIKLCVETHLLDFNQNLYGEKISVDFIKYLREEKKFQSKEELINQIFSDIKKASE